MASTCIQGIMKVKLEMFHCDRAHLFAVRVVRYMVVISLDSPSCGVCLFDPRSGGCIGTLPDRPIIVPFEVRSSRCCLHGDGQRT